MTPNLPTTAYIPAPKMASTAVCAALGVTHEHVRAVDIGSPCWGTIRGPREWYRSWYGHVTRWGGSGNERCEKALDGLGRGDRSYASVLWGLTHLDEIDRGCLPASDHLFAPGGLVAEGRGWKHRGLWSASVDWFFRGHGRWVVEELIHVRELEGRGVEWANVGKGLPQKHGNLEDLGSSDLWMLCEVGIRFGVRW